MCRRNGGDVGGMTARQDGPGISIELKSNLVGNLDNLARLHIVREQFANSRTFPSRNQNCSRASRTRVVCSTPEPNKAPNSLENTLVLLGKLLAAREPYLPPSLSRRMSSIKIQYLYQRCDHRVKTLNNVNHKFICPSAI